MVIATVTRRASILGTAVWTPASGARCCPSASSHAYQTPAKTTVEWVPRVACAGVMMSVRIMGIVVRTRVTFAQS